MLPGWGLLLLKKFMIIPKEYNFIKIIGFSLLCLTLWALPIVTMAETDTDSFYGNQLLNSIVDGEKTTLTLPGGAKVTIIGQETVYTVPDHTQSVRMAVKADNTISGPIAYTPFGDRQAGDETSLTERASESYAGQTFEPETATYDYHARSYDGASARFTRPDAIRESISPYSYTENNPINYVDPTGLGRITFYLYSVLGVGVEYGVHKMNESRHNETIHKAIDELKLPVKPLALELPTTPVLSPDDQVKHLIVDIHTNTQEIDVFDPKNFGVRGLTGKELAKYLYERLKPISRKSVVKEVESICLVACMTSYSKERSPAYRFAHEAFRYFPKLKNVIASPYGMSMMIDPKSKDLSETSLKFKRFTDTSGLSGTRVKMIMQTRDFFTGNLPPELFSSPDLTSIYSAAEYEKGHITKEIINDGVTKNNLDLVDFTRGYRYYRPSFEKIYLRPEEERPPEIRPVLKKPSVDIKL